LQDAEGGEQIKNTTNKKRAAIIAALSRIGFSKTRTAAVLSYWDELRQQENIFLRRGQESGVFS